MEQAPDGWFYYAVTLAFGGALIYVILRYSSRVDKTLEKVQETLIELKTMTSLHEVHIQSLLKKADQQGDEMQSLRDFYIVTYKK